MTRFAIDALLIAAVLCAWLGCLGFARLEAPLDRLHAVAFVNWTTIVAVTLAALAADGLSNRACKLLLTTAVVLLVGAAASHAAGRALVARHIGPSDE